MFSLAVWKKYIFRVLKIITLVIVCHQVINAKILGKEHKHLRTFYFINNILCIFAGKSILNPGAVNMYLMHPAQMGEKKKAWIMFHHIKFVTALVLFTPVVTLIPLAKNTRINLQFYWVLISLILAPMARYYREYSMMRER